MNKMKLYFPFILYLFISYPILAFNTKNEVDSMERLLVKHPPYLEHVRLLRNLIDLAPSNHNINKDIIYYSKLLFQLGKDNNDEYVQLEALRNMVNNDLGKQVLSYIRIAKNLPINNMQKENVAYMEYEYTLKTLDYENEKTKGNRVLEMIHSYRTEKNKDIYIQVEELFNLCAVMSSISMDNIYSDYINKLGKLIEKLPADGRSILPDVYYVLAANFFFHKGMQKEALAADRHLLAMVPKMEAKYREEGRIFKKTDVYQYISYRRMLAYSSILTPKEIDEALDVIKRLARGNKEIAEEVYGPTSIVMIRYNMSLKRYADAKSFLDRALASTDPSEKWMKNECLLYRIFVGKMMHEGQTLLPYMMLYTEMLEGEREAEIAKESKELQVLHNVNDLTQQVNELNLEKKQAFLNFAILVIVIILFFLVITFRSLMSSKKLAKSLQRSKEELMEARNQAEKSSKLKSLFIQNMSHQIRTPLNAIVGFTHIIVDNKGTLSEEDNKQFVSLVDENNELLLSIVSDVLYAGELESGEQTFVYEPVSSNMVCSTAVDHTKHFVKDGVEMKFVNHADDFSFSSDYHKVELLLIHYLTNAAKFTKKGEIVLDYEINEYEKKIIFSVTDTGSGIPIDKADIIFQRFEKLNDNEVGTGLGLHICNLIAQSLKGEVKLDISYQGGSRFLFIHPF